MLDLEGVIDWNAEGEHTEEKRQVASLKDTFDPPFDESQLGSDVHAEWEKKVRADFE